VKVLLFDVETTGFPKLPVDEDTGTAVQPYITQLSATVIGYTSARQNVEYEVIDSFTTYVSGAKFIPKNITDLTGVTMEKLKSAPPWLDIRDRFFKMSIDAGIVCAHNLQFDARMVQIEELRLGNPKPFSDVKRRCTLSMSRIMNKSAPSHALGKLHKHLFGEDLLNAHTADSDVAGLVRVYVDLVGKGAWQRV